LRELKIGETIDGRFQIISVIGSGAMGFVYEVEQVFLKQRFALKTMSPIAVSEKNIRRFQQEARAASRLEHPNLVRSTDFGLIDGAQPFLVMDLVRGQTLADYLQKQGRIQWEQALKIFIPICFAIDYAHGKGIIHRDIKPGNIVLLETRNSQEAFIPKIVDFGIAKIAEQTEAQSLTKTGEVFGTPLYMSPEQCAGTAVDNRSDIYSLGCVIFESLSGTPPFIGSTSFETMMKHLHEQPPSLQEASMGLAFPDAIEKIVARMLAQDANQRYSFCGDVAGALMAVQQGDLTASGNGQHASKSSALSVSPEARSVLNLSSKASRKIEILLACLVCGAIAGGAGYWLGTSATVERSNTPPLKSTPSSTSSTITPLLKSNKMFSTVAGGKRYFEFGDYVGKISSHREGKTLGSKNATGKFDCDAKEEVWFETDWSQVEKDPTLLSRFRVDDLVSLTIKDSFDLSDLNNQSDFDDSALAFAHGLTRLKRLCLEGPITSRGLSNIQLQNMHLQFASFKGVHVSSNELCKLLNFDSLNILMVDESAKDKDSWTFSKGGLILDRLKGSKKIQGIWLCRCGITDFDLLNCIDMTQLDRLDLQYNPGITDKALDVISKLRLQQICVTGTSISPAGIERLRAMNIKLNEPSHT